MLVCTLGEKGGGGLKKCTVCTLMKMLTFLDGPLAALSCLGYEFVLFWDTRDTILIPLCKT